MNTIDNINLMEVYYKSKQNFNTSLIQRSYTKKGNKEYENILKEFVKGDLIKKKFIKKDMQSIKEESISFEENIKSSENDKEEIQTIKNLNDRNLLKSYIQNNQNQNENSNNNIYDKNIKSSASIFLKNNDNNDSNKININNNIMLEFEGKLEKKDFNDKIDNFQKQQNNSNNSNSNQFKFLGLKKLIGNIFDSMNSTVKESHINRDIDQDNK